MAMTVETMSIPETTPPTLRPSIYLYVLGVRAEVFNCRTAVQDRLAHRARPFRVEGPAVDVVLHTDAIVPGIQAVFEVQLACRVQSAAAPVCVNTASEMSTWLLDCEPRASRARRRHRRGATVARRPPFRRRLTVRAALVSARTQWHDASMSENTGRPSATSDFGDEAPHSQPAAKADHGRPATQPMRTVSQRRRDSEEKLEQHLREAGNKRGD